MLADTFGETGGHTDALPEGFIGIFLHADAAAADAGGDKCGHGPHEVTVEASLPCFDKTTTSRISAARESAAGKVSEEVPGRCMRYLQLHSPCRIA